MITPISSNSIVSADVELTPTGNIFNRFVSWVSRNDASNNFELTVTPLPEDYLLPIGEEVPNVILKNRSGKSFDLFSILDKKPTLIMVYSNWNTLAEEQIEQISKRTDITDKYTFIPISTMELDNVNLSHIDRGEYNIEFYKPTDVLYDDYKIISLPQFFVLDKDRKLVNIIVGPQSAEDLNNKL